MKSLNPIRLAVLAAITALSCTALRAETALPTDLSQVTNAPGVFEGKFYRGCGDIEYLQLLEVAARMFEPDPELPGLHMLYEPEWNGLTIAADLRGWSVHRSYGTTYSALPFLREPFLTFLQNSQDLWFDQMGDDQRAGAAAPFNWVAPDGALGDRARPGAIFYKNTDGKPALHDWAIEPTAAAVLMQAEALLISRDPQAIQRLLPKLERASAFVETHRARNYLYEAGPAANLLAPSYAGFRQPDGSFAKAYLAGLAITQIAALDRLIELEKLAGRTGQAATYTDLRAATKRVLPMLETPDGYFVKSIDPDGTKHGVLWQPQHGYFESQPNLDAIAFRVADDTQAGRIYSLIASLRGLRPYDFILPNYPSYDDMYEKPEGDRTFGRWVNGGHWSSLEARAILAYYRLGKFDDARRSMLRLLDFALRFQLDNPLAGFGSEITHTNEPINLCYDAFGPAAAFLRGLFEYRYTADGLTLLPHVPPTIAQLDQLNPVRLGKKKIYLSTAGTGPVTAVKVNGKPWDKFDANSISLPHDLIPESAKIEIVFGDGKVPVKHKLAKGTGESAKIQKKDLPPDLAALDRRAARLRDFVKRLTKAKLADTYEAAHAQLAIDSIATVFVRRQLQAAGQLTSLPEPAGSAADRAYLVAAARLCDGLEALLKQYETSADPTRQKIHKLWLAAGH